jgi:hypothetical protein
MILTLNEWQHCIKNTNDIIVQASAKNGSDGWQPFPIGMHYSYGKCNKDSIQIGPHHTTVLLSIVTNTDQYRRCVGINRRVILDNLRKNNILNVLDRSTYFEKLPTYKFVISPEGNGIDCHRHYEALFAGCIPIVEYNAIIEEKYKGCPILYTTDYSEITEEYLLQKYKEMIDETYDFSRLFLSYYDIAMQKTIKECGNFWMRKLTNKVWYPP